MEQLTLTLDDATALVRDGNWVAITVIAVVGVVAIMVVGVRLAAGSRRRANTMRVDEVQYHREANLRNDGPPRFNG